MTAQKTAKETKPATVVANDHPAARTGRLKALGGSPSDDWNNVLANQTVQALWLTDEPERSNRQRSATIATLVGIGPRDELEGVMAAQLVAAHNSAMECYRRAMIPEQSFEGRRENLSQANKLSRTYATLLEALDRHRGKGQQKVTVEHVHVYEGGQAVVGVVTPGGGDPQRSEDQPHAKQLTHAPQPPMWSTDKTREPVQIAGDDERPMSDARRGVAGRITGK